MTIASTARKAGPLLGNGSATSFSFGFKVFATGDVKVAIADSAGVETVLVEGTHYTVSLNANQETSPGGSVTYPVSGSPLPVGSVLSIIGDLDYDQPLDLPSGGNFSPLALENQLDRATIQIQQLREEMDRTAKLPPTSSESVEKLVDDLQRIAGSADNLDSVAGSLPAVNTVATSIADVNTVASNLTDVTNFSDVYYGPRASDPTLRKDGSALQSGDLYFNTGTKRLRVFDGAAWVDGPINAGTITLDTFSGTGAQTAFTLSVDPVSENNAQVFIGGVYRQKSEYSVSGTTLTFSAAPAAGTNNIEVLSTTTLALGTTDAALVGFQQAGAGAVARTGQDKLRETVSVKDFGAVGDNATDDTAAVQKAYNYVANNGGGKVVWPRANYKIDGTLIVGTNTITDLGGSRIYANGQTLFDTGYLVDGVLVTNNDTLNTDLSTSALQNTTIGNGRLFNHGLAFRLYKFISGCHIHDIEFNGSGKTIQGRVCFYSNYSRLVRFGPANFVNGTADTTSGSSVIVVTDDAAATLAAGMTIGTGFVPFGTTILTVGAAGSGGSGLTNVTLSENASYTVASGAAGSGWVASSDLVPQYKFDGECGNMRFEKVSAASSFIGWECNDVTATAFTSPDITSCAYGFRFKGSAAGTTVSSLYTERVYQWVYDFSECTSGFVELNAGLWYQVAGSITAGASGHVQGKITLPDSNDGFTPYGFSGGASLINLESANADVLVVGGKAGIRAQTPSAKSRFLNKNGLSFQNVAIADAKTLDWYEEGTFTPFIEGQTTGGVGTYTKQEGRFTRIGNRVFFSIYVQWTDHTGTGFMLLKGWPYPPVAVYRSFPVMSSSIAHTAGFNLSADFGSVNFVDAQIREYGNGTGAPAVNMDTTGNVLINGHYDV